MKKKWLSILWGIILIVSGVLFMLNNIGILDFQYWSNSTWVLIFGAVAVLFLVTYLLQGVRNWGWLFPATVSAGIALVIGLNDTALGRLMGGAPILAAIAVPFLVAFFTDTQKNKWALIPAWVMTVITAIIFLADKGDGNLVGALVLYSIGLPFLVVYLTDKNRKWALIPFGVMTAIGTIPLLQTFIQGPVFDLLTVAIFAVAFIIVFLYSRKSWWALIPAGVFSSITLGLAITEIFRVPFPAEVFLAGLGLTFGVLWFMRSKYPTDWAKIPAVVLLVIAMIVILSRHLTDLFGPIVLITVGAFVLILNYFVNGKKKDESEKKED